MASRMAIWTDFRVGRNDTGKAITHAKRGMRGFAKHARIAGDVMRGFLGGALVYGGLARIHGALSDITNQFVEFDNSITAAGARFGEEFHRGTKGAQDMRSAVRDVGATTEFTAAQVAQGLGEYAKGGIEASAAMQLLQGTAKLATNAEVEFAQAASISLDALDSFNLRSKDAVVTSKNLANVNDVLTTVVTSAKLDFEDFAETLKYAGPVAQSTGAKLKDMAVLTGLVAKAGIRGTMAGTTLKNTYLKLVAPVGKGKTALKKLGIQVADNNGNMRDALDILIDFKKKTEDMGNVKRTRLTSDVFGLRAVAGVSKILSIGTDDLEEYRQKINQTAGASRSMADEMRESIQNRIAKIKSAVTELGFKFFDAFGPSITVGIDRIGKYLDEANRPGSELGETIKDIASGLKSTIKFVVDHRETIMWLAKSYLQLKAAMMISNLLTGLAGGFAFLTQNIMGPTGALAGVKGLTVSLKALPGIIGPVSLALMGGIKLGTELWNAIDRAQKKAEEYENRKVKDTVGAKKMTFKEASSKLSQSKAEWEKGRTARFGAGMGDEELMTGDLSSNRAVRMQQEVARAMQRRIDSLRSNARRNLEASAVEPTTSDQNLPWFNMGREQTMKAQEEYSYQTEAQRRRQATVERQEVEIIHTHEFKLPEGVTMTETSTRKKGGTSSNPLGEML